MNREDQLALAGRYGLGLMEGTERDEFEAAMQADPELAAMVRRLESALQTLDDTAEPAAIPAGMWDQVEARIAATPQDAPAPGANVIPLKRKEDRPQRRPPRFARPVAMAASLVLALGLGYIAGTSFTTPAGPIAIAVLQDATDAAPGAIVEAFADDSVRLRPLRNFDVPDGKILQVWTLPSRETGPVSLGTLARSADARLQGPALPSPKDGQLYEITLEPAPGSPTGRPTGPILVKGYARFVP